MKILHVCGVEKKMTNGATVAVVNHVNAQVKTRMAKIYVCHVRDVSLPWDDKAEVIPFSSVEEEMSKMDLVIFHEIYYMPFFSLAEKLYKNKIKYIIVLHGGLTSGAQSQKKLAKTGVNLVFANKYLKHAAALQFLSETEKKNSKDFGNRTFVSPNGVHIPSVYKQYESKDGLDLLFIGRFSVFYKGLDLLLEACEKIHGEMLEKNIRLHLYGPKKGADYEELVRLVKSNGLSDVVTIGKSVFGEEKEECMQMADIFIQPSRSEGQPMGILEALAFGLPVIVTPGTSFDGLVEAYECGYVTEPDAKAIADTILSVYESKDTLPAKSLSAMTAAMPYSWDIVARSTLGKYQEIIG